MTEPDRSAVTCPTNPSSPCRLMLQAGRSAPSRYHDRQEPDHWVPTLGDELRGRPMFWISLALIVLFLLMAIFPQLFTSKDPAFADLSKSREKPSADAWFGRDTQGYDVYARTVYGARASIAGWHPGDVVQSRVRVPRRNHRRLPRRLGRLGDRTHRARSSSPSR